MGILRKQSNSETGHHHLHMCQHLEYCAQFWPVHLKGQRGDEGEIQKRATKMIEEPEL